MDLKAAGKMFVGLAFEGKLHVIPIMLDQCGKNYRTVRANALTARKYNIASKCIKWNAKLVIDDYLKDDVIWTSARHTDKTVSMSVKV